MASQPVAGARQMDSQPILEEQLLGGEQQPLHEGILSANDYEGLAGHAARMARATSYGYAQGHELSTVFSDRAGGMNSNPTSGMNTALDSPDDRTIARDLLTSCFKNATNFLDLNPVVPNVYAVLDDYVPAPNQRKHVKPHPSIREQSKETAPDLGILSEPLPTNSPITRAVTDEIERTLLRDPSHYPGLGYLTKVRDVYLSYDTVKDDSNREYVIPHLRRGPNHEELLSNFGYPHNAMSEPASAEETGQVDLPSKSQPRIETDDLEQAYGNADNTDIDMSGIMTRGGAVRVRTEAIPTPPIASQEYRSERLRPISGSVSEFYNVLNRQLRDKAGSSRELDMLEDRVKKQRLNHNQFFTRDSDPRTENTVRLGIEHAVVSAATFLAPLGSGRLPNKARLLEISSDGIEDDFGSNDAADHIRSHLGELFGIATQSDSEVMQVGTQHMITTKAETIYPGVTLRCFRKPGEKGANNRFEVWLERTTT